MEDSDLNDDAPNQQNHKDTFMKLNEGDHENPESKMSDILSASVIYNLKRFFR